MSAPDETQLAQVRAWLQDAGHNRTLEWTRDYVAKQWDGLFEVMRDASPEGLVATPASGEWSALEAYRHLVEWNWQVGEDILHVCLMGERPGNPPPSFPLDRDELTKRARESLESIWAHVSEADPKAFLELRWEHPFFGQLDWREWYLFLAVHVIDHSGQINAALGRSDG